MPREKRADVVRVGWIRRLTGLIRPHLGDQPLNPLQLEHATSSKGERGGLPASYLTMRPFQPEERGTAERKPACWSAVLKEVTS